MTILAWRAATAGLDLAILACAGLNFAFFLQRLVSRSNESPSRRLAAAALALVSLGALAESVFLVASSAVDEGGPKLALIPWAIVRGLAFAATSLISVLVLRRIIDQ